MKKNKGHKGTIRLLSLLLCLALVTSLLPAAALAAEEDTPISARVNEARRRRRYLQVLHLYGASDPVVGSSRLPRREPTATPTVTITDSGSVFLPDKVTITGACSIIPSEPAPVFTVLTAGDVYSAVANDTTIHRWADIVIDTTPPQMSGFGTRA
jgi:hypothetical protein